MNTPQCLAVLFTLTLGVSSAVPLGYHIIVTSDCGYLDSGDASITVIADLPMQAKVVCANGDFPMNNTDRIHHDITAHFVSDWDGCVFFKQAESRVYLVYVLVSIDNGNDIEQQGQKYTVTCDLGNHGSAKSSPNAIIDGDVAPLETQTDADSVSESEISLYFTDANGVAYPANSNIPFSAAVHLVAETDGADGESGIQVMSCDVLSAGQEGTRYHILRAGCGDGLILPRNLGFTTTGLKAVSSAFSMFIIPEDPSLKIVCNISLCKTTCDGSSCENERRLRATSPSATEFQAGRELQLESSPVNTVVGVTKSDLDLMPDRDFQILLTIATCITLVFANLFLIVCVFPRRMTHESKC